MPIAAHVRETTEPQFKRRKDLLEGRREERVMEEVLAAAFLGGKEHPQTRSTRANEG
jgi:hypothetical protein